MEYVLYAYGAIIFISEAVTFGVNYAYAEDELHLLVMSFLAGVLWPVFAFGKILGVILEKVDK